MTPPRTRTASPATGRGPARRRPGRSRRGGGPRRSGRRRGGFLALRGRGLSARRLGNLLHHGLPLALVLALVVAGIVVARSGVIVMPWTQACVASVGGRDVRLDPEQARNAATIAAVAVARDLPARAVTIALATAYQESDLRNLDHGDRDSLGLFQQRPSQGWGTPAQVQDPEHAAGRFYDALVKVRGYQDLSVTEAAQRVQRSAFPHAYADHEADARVLASALTGHSEAAFTCRASLPSTDPQLPGSTGLTPRAAHLRAELEGVFGRQSLGGFSPRGVTSGHMAGSAHYSGRAVDVFFRPAGDVAQNARGWAVAQWAVANAERLRIATVIYDDRIWTAARSGQGWRTYTPPERSGDPTVLRHLDHVHLDVP